ncbi:hypothetical protein BEWA_006070 [Theileria equi strain WA]|uniref:Condensin complex subunit 1 C-terminal domain-containing protein n=1 Tax=Theileria equi strain WA TaxID=1537102 RepID=L0B104_THEEQ|nr:hypothetical protein BEWA_006070 [Theileria equi strain WA]AFZ81198.1 hypothetical protein BEWA_006070 [Theileria equi strain WA]|eukprot:XP_004830864.1 hypothetical protein BEWA_006070 [Theileria equi strain WA]
MDTETRNLRHFEISDSLDWHGVLRPPGPEDTMRLDASEAEDPEGWTESDVLNAMKTVTDIVSDDISNCLEILTTDVFNAAFNLIRYYHNMDKKDQISLCQILSSLCDRIQRIVDCVPPTPYTSANETLDNVYYSGLERKILSFSDSDIPTDANESGDLPVKPREVGLIMRSLINVIIFLVSMCHKIALDPPNEDEEKASLTLGLSNKRGKGSKKKKDSIINTVAINQLVEAMLNITKINMILPFSGEYSGNGYPNPSMLRMLFQTMLATIALEHKFDKINVAVARMMKIQFSITESKESTTPTSVQNLSESARSNTENSTENIQNYEWITMLMDEIKKPHSITIVDVLELVKDTQIPKMIINETIFSAKDNALLHSASSNQLMSASVQTEFTNIGLFIEKVTKKIPDAIIVNISDMKQLFSIPSYSLRKSVLESIKMLIILSKSDDETENGDSDIVKECTKQREQLFDMVFSRQFDTYMYARAYVLKIVIDLIECDALPIRMYNIVCSLALSRLMDRGAQVRQRALSLMSIVISDVTNKKFLVSLNVLELQKELDMINSKLGKVEMLDTNPEVESSEYNEVDRKNTLFELTQDFGALEDGTALKNLKEKLEIAREMYTAAVEIAENVITSIDMAKKMLKSPTEIDQKSAIKYIATCHLLGITVATEILPSIWELSWATNQNVVDAVLNEFKNVYFYSDDYISVAKLLIKLVSNSNLGCLASIEKILEVNVGKETPYFSNMDKLVTSLLTIAVAPNNIIGRDSTPIIALEIVRLVLWSCRGKKTEEFDSMRNFDKHASVVRNMFKSSIMCDSDVFGELCLILTNSTVSPTMSELSEYAFGLFVDCFGSMDDVWFKICQCVIDLTFTHCKDPEVLWSKFIITRLTEILKCEQGTSLRKISQLIFVCGHLAIRTVISVDKLQNDLKSSRSNLECMEGVTTVNDASNNMGMVTKDEKERDIFENLCENNIVCSNLLGEPILKLIITSLHNPQLFINDSIGSVCKESLVKEISVLKTAVTIAICKYATVSKKFCNAVFTLDSNCTIINVIISLLLNKRLDPDIDAKSLKNIKGTYYYSKESVSSTLRSTLLICYGDLLCRHPNVLEPWNDQAFQLLLDSDEKVRETAVLVFTHLVMNDMVKPKGKLLDGMMFLTLDKVSRISECAKLFFHEIDKKNPNTIYNCFPEMIATLARNKRNQPISRNLKILNMLFNFIKKDKHHESIVEKICTRLQSTDANNKSALCIYINVLLKINYDEKSLTKLNKSLHLLRHLLFESQPLLATIYLIHCKIKSTNIKATKNTESSADQNGEDIVTNQPDSNVIKGLADELMSKINAIFGPGRASYITKATSNANQIIAELEKDQDIPNPDKNLYIQNFGYVTVGADTGFSDYDEDDNLTHLDQQIKQQLTIKDEPKLARLASKSRSIEISTDKEVNVKRPNKRHKKTKK